MSDSNKPKPLPPDDFGATTPNIKIPKTDLPSGNAPSNDWEKTNYNYTPKELGREEWGKTAYNIPKATPPPPAKDAEWGVTDANINLPGNQSNQYGQSFDDDFGAKPAEYGKTSVGINLPRNEPPKYQEPPSEKKEEAAEERKKGGIPGWLWASAGLLGMFLFAVTVLLVVYFYFLGKTGFEVVVKGAPVRSDVMVDGSYWGVTASDGNIYLPTLKDGETKKISIKSPGWTCPDIEVSLKDIDEAKSQNKPVEKNAGCANTGKNQTQTNQPNVPNECLKPTNFDISRQCAYTELNKLEAAEKAGQMFTVEQLLYAMNLYLINFDPKKYDIKPIDMKFIERAASFMKKLPPTTIIEVGGHTDSDGTEQDNQTLSDNRATSVRNALVAQGINSTMLKTKGYGEKQPKDTNDTKDGKFRNRRIEYTKAN